MNYVIICKFSELKFYSSLIIREKPSLILIIVKYLARKFFFEKIKT